MTIDSGSFENLEMIQKLGLEIILHPNPYQLCLLLEGIEIKFSKRCLVFFFSIGKNYKDEWCDVVPMDVCHLLLGRTWLYVGGYFIMVSSILILL